ncbi:hypothetical protein FRC15_003441 [Serendipita sp. 397]|nr:hypothetical protein FRC15_003441 [Serendipita sp. 397]
MQSQFQDIPVIGIRQRRKLGINPSWKVTVATTVFWLLVTGSLWLITTFLVITLVPLAFLFTFPVVALALIVLALTFPQLIHIYFADPADAKGLIPVTTIRRCFQIDLSVIQIANEVVGVGKRIARDILVRRVRQVHYHKSILNVKCGRSGPMLDIYVPLDPQTGTTGVLSPVIIFIPPQIRPFVTRKLVFSSLGANLAESTGAAVIIPDLTNYPEGRVKEQVEEIRCLLNWTNTNIHQYGGDPLRIILAGLGIGGLLALLVPLQAAIVKSRDIFVNSHSEKGLEDLPAGVKEVKEYGGDYQFPRIEGLILISPITNVDEQLAEEASRGMQHLSMTKRVLGPDERTCYFHSPAHLLYAARNIIRVDMLPQKILFLHGGLDRYITHKQSETMKEILRGVGVQDTVVKVYKSGHWGTALPLLCDMQGSPIVDEVYNFLWSDDFSTIHAESISVVLPS